MSGKTIEFEGIGTVWKIKIWDKKVEKDIENIIKNIVTEFNDHYSRFKNDSLVSKLNNERQLSSAPLELLEMLTISEQYKELTGGVFDILTETNQVSQGYDQNYSFIPKKHTQESDSQIIVNNNTVSIIGSRRIDLGGIGKGYVIDKVAKALQKNGVRYFLINAGGDMYGTSNYQKNITLFLQHPTDRESFIGKVSINNQSLCASSPHLRSWKHGGKKYTHIIDPLNPEKEIKNSCFVVSSSAVDADILATIGTILPFKKILNIGSKTNSQLAIIEGTKLVRSKDFPLITSRTPQ